MSDHQTAREIELQEQLQKTQAGLLQIMKDAGDLIRALQSNHDFLFSDRYPGDLICKLGEAGRIARDLLPPHELWDLTNDPKYAAGIKQALGRDEHGNKIPIDIDED